MCWWVVGVCVCGGGVILKEISLEFHHNSFPLLESHDIETSKGWHEQRLLNFTDYDTTVGNELQKICMFDQKQPLPASHTQTHTYTQKYTSAYLQVR